MIEKIIKDKRISLVFVIIFIFLLFVIVYVILSDSSMNKKSEQLSEEDKQEIVKAGNFLSPNLKPLNDKDFYIGKKNAKLQVIVYEDLSDYYSLEFNETIQLIKNNFSDKVVIVFRPYINKASLDSVYINLWLQCAGEQNKFFEARNLLLDKLSQDLFFREDLLDYSITIDLDQDSVSTCLKQEKYLSYLESVRKEAETYDVYGSPTTFVDNEMVVGSRPFDDIINGGGEKLEGMKNIIIRNLNR